MERHTATHDTREDTTRATSPIFCCPMLSSIFDLIERQHAEVKAAEQPSPPLPIRRRRMWNRPEVPYKWYQGNEDNTIRYTHPATHELPNMDDFCNRHKFVVSTRSTTRFQPHFFTGLPTYYRYPRRNAPYKFKKRITMTHREYEAYKRERAPLPTPKEAMLAVRHDAPNGITNGHSSRHRILKTLIPKTPPRRRRSPDSIFYGNLGYAIRH
jgi:hypothetical protein